MSRVRWVLCANICVLSLGIAQLYPAALYVWTPLSTAALLLIVRPWA